MKKINRSTILREQKRQAMKGSKNLVMYRLAYHFLKVAGVEPMCCACDGKGVVKDKYCKQCGGSGKHYDANKQARGLSAIYKMAGKDEERAKEIITIGGKFYEEKNLNWLPITIWRNWEVIQKWNKDEEKDNKLNPDLYE